MTTGTSSASLLWPSIVWSEDFAHQDFHRPLIDFVLSTHAEVSLDSAKDYLVQRHNIFESQNAAVNSLGKLIHHSASRMMSEIYQVPGGFSFSIQGQVGVTKEGSHLPLHDHSKNDFAGVYYPHDLQGQGGELRLFDHRRWRKKFLSNNPGFHEGDWFEITPREGLFVLFPGFIPHDVATWFGKQDRVVISVVLNVETERSQRLVPLIP